MVSLFRGDVDRLVPTEVGVNGETVMRRSKNLRHSCSDVRGARRRGRRFSPAADRLEPRALLSTTWTVTSAGDQGSGTLRDALASARSGDSIVFAPQLQGKTIRLTGVPLVVDTSVTITGPGSRGVTINARGRSTAFVIDPGVQVTIHTLTIEGGKAAQGGGIVNDGGLDLFGCIFQGNRANQGGAIENQASGAADGTSLNPATDTNGTLSVSNCQFIGNSAVGATGQQASGGAIESIDGNLAVASSTFTHDRATGGSDGGNGLGGAIDAIFSVVDLAGNTFTQNGASGGSGGGSGIGGAVDIQSSPSLMAPGVANQTTLAGDTFQSNSAKGGRGGGNGLGGAVRVANDLSSASDGVLFQGCHFYTNQAIGGAGSNGGDGAGGAIKLGSEDAPDTTIAMLLDGNQYIRNQATGGKGTIQGGDGQGGAVDLLANNPPTDNSASASSLARIVDALTKTRITSSNSTGQGNMATGGAGGGGGEGGVFHMGFGGGILQLEDSGYTGNAAIGGVGNPRNGTAAAGGTGGAIVIDSGSISLSQVGVSGNEAMGTKKSFDGGRGGGLAVLGGILMDPESIDQQVTGNQAQTSPNLFEPS